ETLLRLRAALGGSRSGIEYDFVGEVGLDEVRPILDEGSIDELIVADSDFSETEMLEIADLAQSRGATVRVAPKKTEPLTSRGERGPVPGRAVRWFGLPPPVFAGADWIVKRAFDLVLSAAVVVLGCPIWLGIAAAIKLTSPGPVFFRDRRVGLNEREFTMLKF